MDMVKICVKKKKNYDTNVASILLNETVVDINILMPFFKISKLKYISAGPSGRTSAEILGSNTTGGMHVCLLRMLCVVR
jgi:hypothetical protein